MVNESSITLRSVGAASVALFVLMVALATSGFSLSGGGGQAGINALAVAAPRPLVAPPKPVPPVKVLPPPVSDVLRSGVLIVISKASQQMFVFKDGALWGTSPVSTGKRGKATPSGVFPILQKRVHHRSNLYSNAPMPHMQRLTWSGIAIHAGRLPGYPASHGCIRLPPAFAKSLYGLTRFGSTTVVITGERLASAERAITLALATPVPGLAQPALPALAAASPRIEPLPLVPVQPSTRGRVQTIQLVAAPSPALADAHWAELTMRHPQLAGQQIAVIPAVVGRQQVYRLRMTASGAHALCAELKRSGETCFNVN
jgi:L,D-transpeptidase catalytic domain/SPOR domain